MCASFYRRGLGFGTYCRNVPSQMLDDEDEKPAIVIDNGSGMMKAGCSGETRAPSSTRPGLATESVRRAT